MVADRRVAPLDHVGGRRRRPFFAENQDALLSRSPVSPMPQTGDDVFCLFALRPKSIISFSSSTARRRSRALGEPLASHPTPILAAERPNYRG